MSLCVQRERSPELKMPSKELNRYMSFVIERLKEKVCISLPLNHVCEC